MNSACALQQNPEQDAGMAEAVLNEVVALIETFAATGKGGSIDLGGLPFSGRDREEIDALLGRGEIAATIDLAGPSEIWETAFAGVWRVRHLGASGIAVDLIEITSIPEILRSDRRDARLAAAKLAQALEQRKAAQGKAPQEKAPIAENADEE